VAARFLGYDWNVLRVGKANDIDHIEHALDVFRKPTGRPTLSVFGCRKMVTMRESRPLIVAKV
jgi:transketolase